jgi:hypothetical protein
MAESKTPSGIVLDAAFLSKMRDVLTSVTDSLEIYDAFDEWMFAEETAFDDIERAMGLRDFFRSTFVTELDWIAQASESPIERMFCSGLLLMSRLHFPGLLRFAPPRATVSEYREFICQWLEQVTKISEIIDKDDTPWSSLGEFLDHAAGVEKLPQDEVEGIRSTHVVYDLMGFKDAFHITQQATLPPSITIYGSRVRPDLYVWLPLDSSFKLLVECDGFQYHGDKTSFTDDRRRDRILKSHGYEVLRFSGPEIFANPVQAAVDLAEYLATRYEGSDEFWSKPGGQLAS